MWLLSVLLLCTSCLLSSANQALTFPADCDEQRTFEVVDEALRSYNNEKEDGNQFVLHRIIDAKLKNEGDQTHYFVDYEIREGSCVVKSGKTWQGCTFLKFNTKWGKCKAHVQFNNDLKVRSVLFQACSPMEAPATVETPVTVLHHQCLGCPQPINTEEMLLFVQSVIEQMNTEANHAFYFDLEKIVNATRQVVRGWNYHIHYLARQTNCSKIHFPKRTNDCVIDNKGESVQCTIKVSVDPEEFINDIDLQCKSETGVCFNCPVKVDPEDPELLTLLRQVMDEYNSNSNHTQLYTISHVNRATKQGFHEQIYEVYHAIKATNCSKMDYSILGDECNFTTDSPSWSCHTIINATDKTINVHSPPECSMISLVSVRVSGLSPLRSGKIFEQNSEILQLFVPIHKQTRKRTEKHSSKNKQNERKEKKDRKNQKELRDKEDSSVELSFNENDDTLDNQELGATKGILHESSYVPNAQLIPGASDNQAITSNTDDLSLLDLLTLPTVLAPKCPGRVWQPVSLIPDIPTVGTFTLGDFASVVKDLKTEDSEKNESVNPIQGAAFSDEDLLI